MAGCNSKTFDFFCSAWVGDAHLLPLLAQELLAAGHSRPLIVISDGAIETDAPVKLLQTEDRLKGQYPAKFLVRLMTLLLANSDADGFVMVDPDSQVWRLPEILEPDAWLGHVIEAQDRIMIAWGCGTYLPRRICETILGRPIQRQYTYLKDGLLMGCRDITLAKHLSKQETYPQRWANSRGHREVELGSVWEPAFESGKWAITHPRKP
jgi:hypothetical protein